jgi:integrase/recombinase XerC
MGEIIPFRQQAPSPLAAVGSIDLYGALLADADCDATRKARVKDVASLARFLGLDDPSRAVAMVISGTPGQANAVALGFKADQLARKLAPNTINRRLSTMRRAVRVARRLGLVDWSLDVELLRSEAYRDTTGPGLEGWRSILAAAEKGAAGGSPMALRDLALVRCLYDRGLRTVEVLRLDLVDVDLDGRRLAVIGKGKQERAWLTINAPTAVAIAGWIRARGMTRGPLMTRTDRAAVSQLERLTHAAVWRAVRRLGRLAGLAMPARPHGLRHAATTRLLDLTGGDVRRVRRFTRHAKLDTVAIYDDARHDFGGQLAELLGVDSPTIDHGFRKTSDNVQ